MTDKATKQMNGEPRAKTRAEERAEAIDTPSRSDLLEQLQETERALALTREQADEHLRNWQRAAADFSNYKRRTEEDRRSADLFANAVLLTRLLAVLDDFDRALDNVPEDAHESWLEGVTLVERKLRSLLEAEGVTPIEAIGQPFDPNLHEAVVHEETAEAPDNAVIGEVQRGYLLHGRVLRPSLVRVANNPGK
ncbi:MAG TPA: nucleotide exchange factor GrpE [Candidatus Limnocylindria bacterium]|jgi:molecular chaperone GrpE